MCASSYSFIQPLEQAKLLCTSQTICRIVVKLKTGSTAHSEMETLCTYTSFHNHSLSTHAITASRHYRLGFYRQHHNQSYFPPYYHGDCTFHVKVWLSIPHCSDHKQWLCNKFCGETVSVCVYSLLRNINLTVKNYLV